MVMNLEFGECKDDDECEDEDEDEECETSEIMYCTDDNEITVMGNIIENWECCLIGFFSPSPDHKKTIASIVLHSIRRYFFFG